MNRNEHIEAVVDHCLHLRLRQALDAMENCTLMRDIQVSAQVRDELEQIRQTYDMLVGAWRRGLPDAERERLYRGLLRRCHKAASLMKMQHLCHTSSCLGCMHDEARRHRNDWSYDAIRGSLESFVADRDMLSLEQPHVREAKETTLYQQHAMLMDDVFNYLVTLGPMGHMADDVKQLLVAPTVDENDQGLMVSALSLSLFNVFDIAKLDILAHTYIHSASDAVRQRALVGVALGADDAAAALYPEMADIIQQMAAEREDVSQELTELQMQLVYSMQTQSDARTLHEEMLPEIIRNSRLRITPQGIEEQDEDTTEDILHPELAEQRIETMERTMKRMSDMVSQGSDIYYGGFAQTKRHPFFSAVSNWFVPFYIEHPGIQQAWKQSTMQHFLERMLSTGGFCDSDRYSIVLLFQQVTGHLPAHIVEMMEKGEASFASEEWDGKINHQSATFLRRIYLQNLYRFLSLHNSRADFASPLSDDTYLFTARQVLARLLSEEQTCQVASFLNSHGRGDDAVRLMSAIEAKATTLQYHLLAATLAQRKPDCFAHGAEYHYDCALQIDGDNVRALSGKARQLFLTEHYAEAGIMYQHLSELRPKHTAYQLSAAACQANDGQYDEALKTLFRITYEQPDNRDALRVLAWTLMAAGRYDEALKHYRRLTADTPDDNADVTDEDRRNHAYCLWLSGDIDGAIHGFHKDDDIDEPFLTARGITPIEITLMREQLLNS